LSPRLPRRAALLLPLAGCAEMRAPAVPSAVPPELVGFAADPLRAGASLAAGLFAEEARGLAGDAARAARGFALLEGLALDAAASPRLAPIPGVVRLLGEAVAETRRAAGLSAGVPGAEAITAYLAAAAHLDRGDRTAAATALAPPRFTPGGEGALARLAAPGALPVAGIATARLEQALRATAPLAMPDRDLTLQPGVPAGR
jgi:hypothetical protein